MATIQAQLFGDHVLVPRHDFERLLSIARRSERVDLKFKEEDLPSAEVTQMAVAGRSFEFWHEDGEGIYTAQDGEPVR